MNAVTAPESTALTLPEAEQAATIANEAFEIAQAYTIDSPEMYEAAGAELRDIAGKAKKLEETRLSLTRPLDESKKRIMDLFRGPLDRLKAAEELLRKAMLTFQAAEQEKARKQQEEAERRAREEREAAERAAAEAAARAAELAAAGDEEAAAQAAAEAEEAAEVAALAEVAPPPAPVLATPKAAGVSTRQTWKAEVVDKLELIKAAAADPSLAVYLIPDEKAIGGVARSLKAETRIPGVRVYAEDGLAVRRA